MKMAIEREMGGVKKTGGKYKQSEQYARLSPGGEMEVSESYLKWKVCHRPRVGTNRVK